MLTLYGLDGVGMLAWVSQLEQALREFNGDILLTSTR